MRPAAAQAGQRSLVLSSHQSGRAAEIRAAVAEARADGLSERLTEVKAALDDAKIERDRLLTIIEQQSAESRPAVVPVSIWDRIFGRR